MFLTFKFAAARLAETGQAAGRLDLAGLISWAMLVLAALVVSAVLTMLRARRADYNGPPGYLASMRLFSRNGRLYVLHGIGSNLAFGVWGVLFNLYLLALGFDVAFIGLYTLLDSTSGAITSIPAGLISDRISRKAAFLVGHGVVAAVSLVAVSTGRPTVLLAAAVVIGAFRPLFGTPQNAFLTENSDQVERMHLYSVSAGASTAAGIVGSSLAGLIPVLLLSGRLASPAPPSALTAYRAVLYAGIACWVASLVPLTMLRRAARSPGCITAVLPRPSRLIFAAIRHPGRIWRLTLPSVLIGLGAGFTMPLLTVYFQQALGASEAAIGATLSGGLLTLLIASFLAPLAAARMGGKVRAIVVTRVLSLPFILLMAFAPGASPAGFAFVLAAGAHVMRMGLMNMGMPLRAAFGTEILHPDERGTQMGIQQAVMGLGGGIATYLGAQLMNKGDFHTPYLLMGALYVVSIAFFWGFFGNQEREPALKVPTHAAAD